MSVRIGDAPLGLDGLAEVVDTRAVAAGGSALEVDHADSGEHDHDADQRQADGRQPSIGLNALGAVAIASGASCRSLDMHHSNGGDS